MPVDVAVPEIALTYESDTGAGVIADGFILCEVKRQLPRGVKAKNVGGTIAR
ncbi:MAG: hypothetical protein IJG37_06360 [Synergistaceae bacterium]|nr:hypothetical protein [Synergistaceae bacterium]MBQ7169382.1 hypothetical protein [Synergistaceae bacterium]MBR0257893.1 hypothetical protein [Synergistaceae bacterium]